MFEWRDYVVVFEAETDDGEVILETMTLYAANRDSCYSMVMEAYPDLLVADIYPALTK